LAAGEGWNFFDSDRGHPIISEIRHYADRESASGESCMAEVILDDVTKIFPGPVEAFKDMTLTVRDEEFIVLVGPSGCGKSTTLRMIAGLEEVTSGTIRIGDRVVNDVPPKDRDIAMVFQNYALYPHMTVFKNMAFGLKPYMATNHRVKERGL